MAIKIEKRLKTLEDELKALKATYSIYGGAMITYVSVSPSYNWTLTNPPILPKVRFTSNWESNKNILISSISVEMRDENNAIIHSPPQLTCEIQDNTGSVVINILPNLQMKKFKVKLFSTSPGTFTRIQ